MYMRAIDLCAGRLVFPCVTQRFLLNLNSSCSEGGGCSSERNAQSHLFAEFLPMATLFDSGIWSHGLES
jgi:hypothetical protein